MIKKLSAIALVLVMIFTVAGCAPPPPPPAAPAPAAPAPAAPAPAAPAAPADAADPADENDGWVIGIMTGTITQNEEEYLAASNMQARFGDDRIIRTTYPANFGAEIEVVISNMVALADQGAQAIVVCQAVPGIITAIQEIRDRFGDDFLFFAGVTHEPPPEVAQFVDVAINSDDLLMGRIIIEQAVAMGADTFAHMSFPRHLGMVNIAARREILMHYAEVHGLEWVELTFPDPMSEGVPVAQMFIVENVPRWVEEHGQNTAFFSTNCGVQEPLITQLVAYGGLYPLQCCPSPFHALPAAMNVDLEGREGDVPFLIDQLTIAFAEAGATGRFSTWPVPVNMAVIEIGVLYAIEYLEGRTSGRFDEAALMRVAEEVGAAYGAVLNFNNWPAEGGGYIENFFLMSSSFVTF